SGGGIAMALSENAASASVPVRLVSTTVKAAGLFAAGQVVSGVLSVKVVGLAEGVLKAMLWNNLKVAAVAPLVLALIGTGLWTTATLLSAPPPEASQSPVPDASALSQPANPPVAQDSEKMFFVRLHLFD